MSKNHRHYVHLCTEVRQRLLIFAIPHDGFWDVGCRKAIKKKIDLTPTHFLETICHCAVVMINKKANRCDSFSVCDTEIQPI